MSISFTPGSVTFVGAGPGAADLLTLRALRAIAAAQVVLHDTLVDNEVLALIAPSVRRIAVGKTGFGCSTAQSEINRMLVDEASTGAVVVRLKGGDPALFGRLDEEIAVLEAARIAWQIVPGITAASAAAASLGHSLTARGRNGAVTFLTGHDAHGFAEQDWHRLARPGAVAAIYMGKRAARFVQGRLLMHGAFSDTPVTLVENASRVDERHHGATLANLPQAAAVCAGPTVMLLGFAPRLASVAQSAHISQLSRLEA